MKSRKACEMYTRKFLDKKQSVIVDRCNFDCEQRKTWIELAQHYKVPVDCIVLTANQQVKSKPKTRERKKGKRTKSENDRNVVIVSK